MLQLFIQRITFGCQGDGCRVGCVLNGSCKINHTQVTVSGLPSTGRIQYFVALRWQSFVSLCKVITTEKETINTQDARIQPTHTTRLFFEKNKNKHSGTHTTTKKSQAVTYVAHSTCHICYHTFPRSSTSSEFSPVDNSSRQC